MISFKNVSNFIRFDISLCACPTQTLLLIRVDGEKWRKLRTKLTTTFTTQKLKFVFPIIVKIGERFRACLFDAAAKHNGDDGLEIHWYMCTWYRMQ